MVGVPNLIHFNVVVGPLLDPFHSEHHHSISTVEKYCVPLSFEEVQILLIPPAHEWHILRLAVASENLNAAKNF